MDSHAFYKYFVPTGLADAQRLILIPPSWRRRHDETIPFSAGPNNLINHDCPLGLFAAARADPRRSAHNQIRRRDPDFAGWKLGRVHGWLWRLQTGCICHTDLAGRQWLRKKLSINPRRQIFDEPALVT